MSFAECHYAECHYAECHYAECHYAECHYAECHYAECHYVECHGAFTGVVNRIFLQPPFYIFLSNFKLSKRVNLPNIYIFRFNNFVLFSHFKPLFMKLFLNFHVSLGLF